MYGKVKFHFKKKGKFGIENTILTANNTDMNLGSLFYNEEMEKANFDEIVNK